MKIITKYVIISSLLLIATCRVGAQTFFSVGDGGNLFIQQFTKVSFDSLTLYPNAGDLLLTTNSITKSTTVSHSPTTGTYISRVYKFETPINGYNGDISFGYRDDELNGIDENSLILEAYTNDSWKAYTEDEYERNPTENYVYLLSTGNLNLDELTLASINAVLPLQWISVNATRENSLTTVNWVTAQETNCKYYQVQRSNDARSWQNVCNTVKANNNSSFNYYILNDAAFLSGTAYYRIVLTDVNGRMSYSTTVSVKDAGDNRIVVYPNPAKDIINVKTGSNSIIRRVKLFDAGGKLLMVREGSNSNVYSFNISSLASGYYMLTVETTNGKQLKGFVKN